MKSLNPLFARILPYLMIVFIIALFILGIFIFSYVLIFAVIVGLVLFAIGYIRLRFFSKGQNTAFHEQILIIQRQMQGEHHAKQNENPAQSDNKHTGRIIEHDDSDPIK